MLVDRDPSPPVRFQIGRRQIEEIRIGLPPDGVKQPFRMQTFAALEPDLYHASLTDLDRGDRFAETKDGSLSPHVIAQRFNDLVIHKVKYGGPLVDDSYFDAEGRHHRGVLKPDHAGSDHDKIARYAAAMPDLIRVNPRVAKRNLLWAGSARAAGDQDVVRLYTLRSLASFNLQRMRTG